MSDLRPPAEIAWLTDVVGAEVALLLMELHGGTRVYVQQFFTPDMKLAQDIGAGPAREMVRRFGGSAPKIPACKWWRAKVYAGRGMTYPQIARKLGCGESSVQRYLYPERQTPTQLSLGLVE